MTRTEDGAGPIPLFRIDWAPEELHNAIDSITRGAYWANGPFVDEFERALADETGVEHAVTFNSGTSALVAALAAHDLGPGDEVIVPSFTFVATANAALAVGATPVFADVETEYYGLDPGAVRAAVTDDTAAIVPVHYAGHPCRIGELREIAAEHDLTLVEDAAEALGATVDGTPVGTIGDAGVLSFCQNKVVTTGEGGAVVTDDDDLARRLRLYRSHGRASGEYFDSASTGEYVAHGFNLRMPDVAAALGVGQIDRLEDLVRRRRAVAAEYADRLADVEGVQTPSAADYARHVYQLFTVTLDATVDRDAVVTALEDRGVASKVYFEPVHLTTFYRDEHGWEPDTLPRTEAAAERVLSLPMHPNLPERHVERVSSVLEDAVAEQLP